MGSNPTLSANFFDVSLPRNARIPLPQPKGFRFAPRRVRMSRLENGMSIENVSVLLGHSSVRITERHDQPWVKTLQKKLEDEVRKAWA